jgi:hypothetical protein
MEQDLNQKVLDNATATVIWLGWPREVPRPTSSLSYTTGPQDGTVTVIKSCDPLTQ